LTEVCRYDTRVITEDEEIGPQGIETNKRRPADGDGSNPILVGEEPNAEPLHQTAADPLEDLKPPKSNESVSTADQIAPVVELLRKRQREEREEADIRREEQVLLNKRLAMMEEQVQMLSKLITQHNPQPAPPSPQADMESNKSADVAAEPEMEAETAATSGAVQDTILIDDEPAEDDTGERSDTSPETAVVMKTVDLDADIHAEDEVTNVAADERADKFIEPVTVAGPDHSDVDKHVMNKAVDAPADVSMGNSVEPPAIEPEPTTTISRTETENDVVAGDPTIDAHGTIDAVTEAMETSATTEEATGTE